MAKTQMTPDEQLDDLQKRFVLLEGERKATYETAKMNIEQNRQIIKQMKEENKDLQKKIATFQKEKPKSAGRELDEKLTELFHLQRRHDAVKAENGRKALQMKELDDKLQELSMDARPVNSEASPEMRHIRVLENRLDKTMIKYNEAQSIRKTYEQIVKRLKEERVGFDNHLQAIERTLKAKERDYEELLLLSHDAYHAKEMAQAELHRFEQGVMEERNQRDREVQEKKILVQQRVEMNQRLEQRERMLKQQQDLDRAGELALKTTSAMAELAAGMSHTDAEEERARLQDYEEAYQRIKDATGVGDVNEVIQKFLTQEDTSQNLKNLMAENKTKIDQLTEEKNRLRRQVEELKFSSGGSVGRRQVIDDFEANLTKATENFDRSRSKYERIAKMLISVKAGIDHLADMLYRVPLDNEPQIEMSDETVEEVLSQSELKLSKLISLTHLDDSNSRTRSFKFDEAKYEEKLMNKSMSDVRIKLSDHDEDQDDDDEDFEDEGMDEDVWNRKHVKYNSEQILEKQNTKSRKRNRSRRKEA